MGMGALAVSADAGVDLSHPSYGLAISGDGLLCYRPQGQGQDPAGPRNGGFLWIAQTPGPLEGTLLHSTQALTLRCLTGPLTLLNHRGDMVLKSEAGKLSLLAARGVSLGTRGSAKAIHVDDKGWLFLGGEEDGP
jgi:hypothetical protein